MSEKSYSKAELMAMDKEQLIRMYSDLQVHAEQLQNQVDWYTEQMNNLKRHKYSSTSEAGEKLLLQLPLFDEAEFIQEEVKEPEPEPETVVKSYKRKHRKNGHAFTVEEIHHNLENTACPVCGTPMQEVKPLIKEVIRHIPEQYILERHIIHQYVCPNCSKNEDNTDIIRAADYPKLLEGSLVSPSLLASVAEQKFNRSLPLYRQEKEFGQLGIPISRQNLSDWLIKVYDTRIYALIELMRKDLLAHDILHGDETTVNCLDEKDREKSYMWVQGTPENSDQRIILYTYHKDRTYDFARELYAGFKGYVQVDGYEGYHNIPGVIPVGCFAHARRYVFDALRDGKLYKEYEKARDKQEFLNDHPAYARILELFTLIEKLFTLEKKYKAAELTPEKRYEARLKEAVPVLNEIKGYLDRNQNTFLEKSKSGRAVTYMTNNWEYLTNYLKDGRLELSNNYAEREMIKVFVQGRKNWLFANTAHGADISAGWYSLVQTAKVNNLKIEAYLTYVMENLRLLDTYSEEQIRRLLPYSKELPDNLKVRR